MREAFDKDDRYCRVRFSQMDQDSKQRPRYCATGDEKYYLDLPGKENEKVVNKLLMRYHFLALLSLIHPSLSYLNTILVDCIHIPILSSTMFQSLCQVLMSELHDDDDDDDQDNI